MRIENPDNIELSNNYIIGLPSRQNNPAYVEIVAVGGSKNITLNGLRITGSVFSSSGAHLDNGGVLHPCCAFLHCSLLLIPVVNQVVCFTPSPSTRRTALSTAP